MSYATSRRGYARHSAKNYSTIGLETEVLSASPERLITLLFRGARTAISQAKYHLEHGNIAERGKAISKAIDIVDSGLKASVSREKGGELALNLISTYDIVIHNLFSANLHADVSKLDVAEQVLKELHEAWTTAVDPDKATSNAT